MKRQIALLLTTAFTSCSVVMASKTDGTDLDSLQNVCTRSELIALGAEAILAEENGEGQRVETYKIQKERGSVARAFMHGLLDLGTGFLWEFAGTPIEHSLDEQKFYSVKVTFDEQEQIQKMELF